MTPMPCKQWIEQRVADLAAAIGRKEEALRNALTKSERDAAWNSILSWSREIARLARMSKHPDLS